FAELRRVEPVCDEQHRLSAECRVQSHGYRMRTCLLGSRRDREPIPEDPRPARTDLIGVLPMRPGAAYLLLLLSTAAAHAEADKQAFEQIARGRYLAIVGDCAGCHNAPGGAPYAGGLPIETPFGTLV